MKKEFSEFNLILINTDGLDEQDLAEKTLLEFSLDDSDNWIFAESNIEKLRHHIDDRWAGELPRSYFYNNDQQRIVVSGLLSQEILEAWLQR